MSKPQIKGPYQRERYFARQSDERLTEQAHARDCDLHIVLNRYKQTGQLPIGNTRGQPQFMDCPDQEYDFKHLQDTIKRSESEFYNLPLEEQAKHGNNPSEWLRGVLSDEFIDNHADTEADAEEGEALSEASPDLENNGGKEPQSGS